MTPAITLKNIDPDIDLLALHTTGARLHPQKSHALPQHCYGDPARHVKFAGERACAGCIHRRRAPQGAACGKGRPFGKRCSLYQSNKE